MQTSVEEGALKNSKCDINNIEFQKNESGRWKCIMCNKLFAEHANMGTLKTHAKKCNKENLMKKSNQNIVNMFKKKKQKITNETEVDNVSNNEQDLFDDDLFDNQLFHESDDDIMEEMDNNNHCNEILKRCQGVIPDILKNESNDNNTWILSLVSKECMKKKRFFWFDEYGIHDVSCDGVLTNTSQSSVNLKCTKWSNDTGLNDLIKKGSGNYSVDSLLYDNTTKFFSRAKNESLSIIGYNRKVQYLNKQLKILRNNRKGLLLKLNNREVKIDLQKRILVLIATKKHNRISDLLKTYVTKKCSLKWLMTKINDLIYNKIIPRNYDKDEVYRSLIILIISGPKLLNILYNSGLSVMSISNTKNWRSKMKSKCICSCIDINKIEKRIMKIVQDFNELHLGCFCSDEIAVDSKVEWNPINNKYVHYAINNNNKYIFDIVIKIIIKKSNNK